MIDLKINGTTYHIKTSFKELTWGEYVNAISGATMERIAVLSSIPVEVLSALPLQRLSEIIGLVSFFDEQEVLGAICKPYESEMVIGQESYGNLEKAKGLIKKFGNEPMKAGAGIVKIYTGEDITGKPLTEVYNMVAFFLPK